MQFHERLFRILLILICGWFNLDWLIVRVQFNGCTVTEKVNVQMCVCVCVWCEQCFMNGVLFNLSFFYPRTFSRFSHSRAYYLYLCGTNLFTFYFQFLIWNHVVDKFKLASKAWKYENTLAEWRFIALRIIFLSFRFVRLLHFLTIVS